MLSEKSNQVKDLLELNIFMQAIWEKKAPNILLCIRKVQVPANKNVAEGDLILIIAFFSSS